MSAEALTKQYAALRATKQRVKEEADEKLRALEKGLVACERALLANMNASGLKSIKTDAGMFTRTETRKYHAADWEQLYDHIVETRNFGLLQKRLGEGATKQFIDESDGKLPPGVSFTDIVGIHFTKPKA